MQEAYSMLELLIAPGSFLLRLRKTSVLFVSLVHYPHNTVIKLLWGLLVN